MSPPSLSPTAPKQGVLRARVDEHIEQAFAALAKQRGIKTSDLLRSLVLAEIGSVGPPVGDIEAQPENAEIEAFTVRLPSFLSAAVKARAKMRGMPPGRWMAALVQSNLSRHPVLNEDEVSALQEAITAMDRIGRNVNQMTKRLNEAFHDTEAVRLETLAEVDNSLVRTRNAVRRLVRSSMQSWKAFEP